MQASHRLWGFEPTAAGKDESNKKVARMAIDWFGEWSGSADQPAPLAAGVKNERINVPESQIISPRAVQVITAPHTPLCEHSVANLHLHDILGALCQRRNHVHAGFK